MGSLPASVNHTVLIPKERLRFHRYKKRDFLLGGTFTSLDNMNSQVGQWLNRVNGSVHGTTDEIPFERLKRENLKSLSAIPPYQIRREEQRKFRKMRMCPTWEIAIRYHTNTPEDPRSLNSKRTEWTSGLVLK